MPEIVIKTTMYEGQEYQALPIPSLRQHGFDSSKRLMINDQRTKIIVISPDDKVVLSISAGDSFLVVANS